MTNRLRDASLLLKASILILFRGASAEEKLRRMYLSSQVRAIFDAAEARPCSGVSLRPKPKRKEETYLLGREIFALRKRRCETQKQFADALGVRSKSLISKWESGAIRPSGAAIGLLASIAEGKTKKFFLAQAGIPFNDAGEIDFGTSGDEA